MRKVLFNTWKCWRQLKALHCCIWEPLWQLQITSKQKVFSKGTSNSMILKIRPTRFAAVHTCSSVQINHQTRGTLGISWWVSVHKTFQNSDAAQGKSYSFMTCRMVHLRHFETLEFWELRNLFKEWPPRTTLDSLDNAYLATMKCAVVNKAFKQVAEKQTKIKVKRHLKASGSFSTRRTFHTEWYFLLFSDPHSPPIRLYWRSHII